jgi:hypothetical protein
MNASTSTSTHTSVDPKLARQESIGAYKIILRRAIDQRPSGIRQKIAQVLGTHKSFISQITNPNDPTPIPARHLDAIIDVCHLSAGERQQFVDAWNSAHPSQMPVSRQLQRHHYKTLHIQIPVLDDSARQQALEAFIQDTVRGLCKLFENQPNTSPNQGQE